MKLRIVPISLLALLLLSSGCNAVEKKENYSCYWKENYSKKYEWVSAKSVYKGATNKKKCFELDSCDGGLGKSGGCYKWSSGPNAKRQAW